MAWRKERREGEHAELELARKRLEIEKLRRAMDKSPKPAIRFTV
jgi:hypothetical protein